MALMDDFDEFLDKCSFDIDYDTGQVVCIFSVGFMRTFTPELCKENHELVEDLTASDLKDYCDKIFRGD